MFFEEPIKSSLFKFDWFVFHKSGYEVITYQSRGFSFYPRSTKNYPRSRKKILQLRPVYFYVREGEFCLSFCAHIFTTVCEDEGIDS